MTPDEERQSAELMRLAQGGDQVAYATLLALLTSVTRKFARGRLGNVVWLDDVVQETLLTVHRARQTYQPARPFAPWFYAIAANRMIDVIRRERRVSLREIPGDDVPDTTVIGGTDRNDVDPEVIRRALASLPRRQRDIIHGLKFQDESVRQVANRMGMTESAVKVAAHRGYRALKRLLGGGVRED